ncbi:MAG: 50S ribosomal protein L9 [Bacteroidetes bacterium HGW-Bacteroidetes-10]|jgi:large subunit ribosomal protein L9|nr:MAG: 50S ribosomal protein L9 [Bacteroidetes bacterium HGW-Bacteroidetes-10]
MEIILKQDVSNLGHKDDIVVVRNGYATNYLIPQGFAIMATPSAKKVHAENMKQRAHKETKLREDAVALAAKLEGLQVTLATKVSATGKIFGSVNNIQVGEALAAKGFEIDRRSISIVGEANVKEVGVYDAVVKIYKDIKANIKVEITGEE